VIKELHAQAGDTVEVGSPIVTIDVDPRGAAAAPEAPTPAPEEQTDNGRTATLVGYGPKSGPAKRRVRKESVGSSRPAAAAVSLQSAFERTAAPLVEPMAPAVPVVPDSPAALEELPPGSYYVPKAKPPVRKLARDLGVDLRSLAGSGSEGVITREDVERAASSEPAPTASTVSSSLTRWRSASEGYDPATRERRVPIKSVRKATATAVVQSAFTAPHVTEFLTVDVTPMMELRARLKNHPAFRGLKITPLTFAAKAVCLALQRTPDLNAVWDAEANEIVFKEYVHLGIAAATPRGLIVPKIRDADQMSLVQLAESIEALTETARQGKTPPADMVRGTFSITNVGVFGVDTGTPIITPGESAILCLGAIRDMPWVVDGQIVPRKVCQLSVSFDHRVIDGQQGAHFLADVGTLLADPSMAITY
jgi:pyruvate dehydrogenase E2 component (dihydrolipoamide acetyltransferase)